MATRRGWRRRPATRVGSGVTAADEFADQAIELGVHQPDDEVATRLAKGRLAPGVALPAAAS